VSLAFSHTGIAVRLLSAAMNATTCGVLGEPSSLTGIPPRWRPAVVFRSQTRDLDGHAVGGMTG
jgi:hypothetical protein